MRQSELDQAIAEVRAEQIDDKAVHDAAKRVFSRLFVQSLPSTVERIRNCADFQALIPAYLDGSLSPARALLHEDHTLQCVACRNALKNARLDRSNQPATQFVHSSAKPKPLRVAPVWALAACLAVGVAIGVTGVLNGVFPWQHTVRATVLSVEGKLYQISEFGSSLVTAGSAVTNAEDLHTAKGARAILRLLNGTQIEVGERSNVSISGGWRGTTVKLERGRIIVDPSEQSSKPFYLMSDNVLIPVTNAVLAVDRGMKGSRVAVARGFAEVRDGQRTFRLAAGEQVATDDRLSAVPIASEFAWSKNSEAYLALLGELSTLGKQMQAIPSPGLRYSSALAKYVPANTVIFAAIPNLGGTLSQAKQIFDQRLTESGVLRDWWSQQSASQGQQFDQIFNEITSISSYLGDEIVFAVTSDSSHHYSQPLILSELKETGLRNYLEQNNTVPGAFRVVDNPATASAGSGTELLLSFEGNVLVATPDLHELQQVSSIVRNPSSGQFLQRPFYSRIQKSYNAGAGYLLSIDMEQIVPKSVDHADHALLAESNPESSNAQYFVLERRDVTGRTETRASLSFAGTRQGVSSWLGAPGAMGSLGFVSPDASFASSLIVKNPRTLLNEIFGLISKSNSRFSQELNEFESRAGVSLLDDVAAPLGTDVTFALDGPLLPVPAWKFAIEMNDPVHFQQTLSTFVDRFDQQSSADAGRLQLKTDQVNSRTFYSLNIDKMPAVAAYYTFVNGYLLAGSSEANLTQAIQDQQTGHTLENSANFRSQLPDDSYTNFSAIVYSNLSASLGPLAGQVNSLNSLTPEQKQALSALANQTGPGLICVYGEPDRIVVATRSTFLGFNLATLANLTHGHPVLPMLADGASPLRSLRPPANKVQ